jgi:hypothetical protein
LKRSNAEVADDQDSETQTDSVTLSADVNDIRDKEVQSRCSRDAALKQRQRKRPKSGGPPCKDSPSSAGAFGDEKGLAPDTAGFALPRLTLTRAAQAAGVYNRNVAAPLLPKMPTMSSATETKEAGRGADDAFGYTVPFQGSAGDVVLSDNSEHAEALQRDSGADPVADPAVTLHSAKPLADGHHTDLASIISAASCGPITQESLQILLQSCAGGQLSVADLIRMVCPLLSWVLVVSLCSVAR